MKDKSPKFDRKKELALKALLTEPTLQSAAKVSGISEVTLWRWQQDEDFAEAFRSLKQEAVGQAMTRLQQTSGEAVETLRSIMNDTDTPAATRTNAAKSIIEMSLKVTEHESIVRRIEEIEKIVKKEGA